jgi:hypothetical protein
MSMLVSMLGGVLEGGYPDRWVPVGHLMVGKAERSSVAVFTAMKTLRSRFRGWRCTVAAMTTSKIPVALPAHWFAEDDRRGTLIHAVDGKGHVVASVTVNEDVRGYLVGVQPVPRSMGRAERYMRRSWRNRLYRDALAALMMVWRSLQPAGLSAAIVRDAARHERGTSPR